MTVPGSTGVHRHRLRQERGPASAGGDAGVYLLRDTMVVHSMDRLARNLEDLRRLVRELTGRGVRVGQVIGMQRQFLQHVLGEDVFDGLGARPLDLDLDVEPTAHRVGTENPFLEVTYANGEAPAAGSPG